MGMTTRRWRRVNIVGFVLDPVISSLFSSNSLFTFAMDVEDVAALRQAVDDCGDRGLLAASKWHAPFVMKRGI
jgi:hypothetical protein